MPKLTLSVDDAVVRRAKRYARARGTSVSRLVERFLDLLARDRRSAPPEEAAAPPVLRRLRGSLKGVTRADYLAHLERKYR
jgi:hypothetical protein